MMNTFEDNAESAKKEVTEQQVDEGIEQLKKAGIETGYDSTAIESYSVFTKLRDEGLIPPGVKFQVGLPSLVFFLKKGLKLKSGSLNLSIG